MSETIEKTTSLVQARAMLGNTRALSSEQIEAAQRIVNSHYASKPRKACAACGCGIWSEHNGGVWACDRCHRGPEVTQEQYHAAETARRRAADEHLRAADAAAASAPKPRARLAEALEKRAEANALIMKLDRGVSVARTSVSDADARYNRAVEALAEIEAAAAEGVATSFYEGTKPTDPARAVAAARRELDEATFARVAARNGRTLLDDKIKDARTAMGYANDRARKAAYGVLVAERMEELLADVAQARATYLESAGQLGWLIKTHVIPDSDRRAHQFLGEANQPPSTWKESATAGIQVMQDALALLMLDADAVI